MLFCRLILLAGLPLVCFSDWLTFAHDPQRTGFTQENLAISIENAQKLQPGWSVQLENAPLALSALTAPVVAEQVATPGGPKDIVFVAGSSDHVFAVDAATGTVLWTKTFGTQVTARDEPYYLCPNSVNATPIIDRQRNILYVIALDGRLYGLDLATGDVRFGPFAFVPAFSKTWSLNLSDGFIYTTTSQGCGGDRSGIYAMKVDDPRHTESHELIVGKGFGGGMWSRGGVVVGRDKRIFVTTGDGAFDPAAGYFGSAFLALEPRSLDLADYYSPSDNADISKRDLDLPSGGHIAFTWHGKEYIAGGGKGSTIYLLDAKSLGGADHHTPTFITPVLANTGRALEEKGIWGSPAVWTDSAGDTWLYVPVWGALSDYAASFPAKNGDTPHGAILAFKVCASPEGKISLAPQWISPDFNLPDPPAVSNGVLFAVATGENPRQDKIIGKKYTSMQDWKDNLLTTAERSAGTKPAMLEALDARSGKLLYSSGDVMKSWVHFSGLAVSGGAVYAVDHDSRLYCFRLPTSK